MAEFTRRELLARGAKYSALAVGGSWILAACGVTVAPSGSSGTAGNETTWQRIQRTKKISIGYPNEPPFDYIENGKLTGQAIEVLRKVLEPHGVTDLEGVLVEFNGLIPGLQAKRFDIIMAALAIRPQRCEQIAFGDPDAVLNEALMVKKGNPKNLHSYVDVKESGALFGTFAGNAEIGYAHAAGIDDDHIVLFPDGPTAVAGLQSGRCDCVATLAFTIEDLLKKTNDPNLERATPFEAPLDEDGNSVLSWSGAGFRKEDTDFLAAYNEGLKSLKESGELATIVEPFGFASSDVPPVGVTAAQLCAGEQPSPGS
jgi:polar amino acid transport system substrate-binding protein